MPPADPTLDALGDRVRQARLDLLTQGLIKGSVPPRLVDEQIERSWRRSVGHAVSLEATPRLGADVELESPLSRATEVVLDQWSTSLGTTNMVLLLADASGHILTRRILDPQDGRALDRAQAAEGFGFGENELGTNGLGTPLEERRSVYISGAEHYTDGLAALTCAGAPILDPVNGRPVGSLAFATRASSAHPLMLGMVRQAAAEVMQRLADGADERDLQLARAYRRLRRDDGSVMVLNADTVMTDLPGLAQMDAEAQAVLWETLRRRRPGSEPTRIELPALGIDAIARLLGGSTDTYVLEFAPTPPDAGDDEAAGTVPADHPPAAPVDALAPVARSDEAIARTVRLSAPRSERVAYDAVGEALTAAAGQAGLVVLGGPPGVGKRFQAVQWLRSRARTGDPVDPLHMELADVVGHRGPALLREAASRGRSVVVSGELSTDSETHAARLRLAGEVSRTQLEHPEAPHVVLLVTQARQAEARSPGHVYIPPLTDLPEDIPVLLRRLVERLHPGAPEPRLSPEARQRILAWPWPDNLRGLSRLVSVVPGLARGDVVQATDLPPALRAGSSGGLSRLEQVERDTIQAALRENEGNRAAAARALGIGRATLYRRLRALHIPA